ncbi:unnamed protein product [Closterium sp. NIES-65]|nr:unnamed protein product [Closterium sp. NIES-65]
MLSAISWVPRGAAKPFPKTAELDEEEVAEVRRRAEGVAAAAAAVAGGDADAEDGEERDAENDEDATMEEEEEEEEGSEEEGEADGEEAAAAAAALAAEIRKAKKGQSADDRLADELAELDMDHYDDEADAAPNLFGTGKGIGAAYYRSNDEDPYLTKAEGAEDEDDEDEIEDLTIRDTDLLILAARNEDDVSFIEVWVCEEQQRQEGEDGDDVAQNDKELNMYVHHDIMLPAFPLALAWMDFNPSAAAAAAAAGSSAAAIAAAGAGASVLAPGNFVAVATMDPAIEIWDLDVLDEVEPAASLGGFVTTAGGAGADGEEDDEEEWEEVEEEEEMEVGGGGSGPKKGSKGKKGKKDKGGKKGKKGREREPEKRGSSNKGKSQGKTSAAAAVLKEGSHKGAVMALSWNREYRSVLASGGEDRRVKVWDMAAQRCDRTLKPHTGKVQAVAWAPLHATSLLSGSFDRSLALRWQLKPHTGKVQAVAWALLHAAVAWALLHAAVAWALLHAAVAWALLHAAVAWALLHAAVAWALLHAAVAWALLHAAVAWALLHAAVAWALLHAAVAWALLHAAVAWALLHAAVAWALLHAAVAWALLHAAVAWALLHAAVAWALLHAAVAWALLHAAVAWALLHAAVAWALLHAAVAWALLHAAVAWALLHAAVAWALLHAAVAWALLHAAVAWALLHAAVAWALLHAASLLSGSGPLTAPLLWWVGALICRRAKADVRSPDATALRCGVSASLSPPPSPPLPLSPAPPLSQTDVRSPDATVLRWGISADVEALAWDPHDSTRFVVSSEDGLICCHDTRAGSSNATAAPIASSASALSSFPNALFTIHAHTKAACTVSWNPRIPNLLASGSTDKTVKLWDLSGNQARCLESSNPKLGAVFSVAFCADAPGFLAMGGSKGKLKVWDTRKVADVGQRFRVDAKAVSAWQWWQIATLYTMKRGSQTVSVSSQVQFRKRVFDKYSLGKVIKEDLGGVWQIIDQQLRTRALPIDSSAQYLVLTSADVALGDREKGFCGRSGYCGFHSFATDGVSYIKYGFVGNGEKCGTRCMRTGGSKRTPNGKRGVDGMISIVAHEVVETANNPRIEGGWYDALGAESSDKCMTDFGPSVAVGGNGYSYNMVGQGGMQWLVESNWRPTEPQGCAMTRY